MGRETLHRWVVLAAAGLAVAAAQGQGFTYQGRLTDGGQPADGLYTLQFRLLDAATGGNQVGPTLTAVDTPLVDGVFTTSLNFGAGAFAAAGPRWLEVAVAPAGPGNFTVLAPRQRVAAAPRALTLEWPASGSAAAAQPMLGLTNNSSGTVVDALNAGTGVAVRAAVTNAASGTNALVATHAGSGSALHAQANGNGKAAVIRNSNGTNTQTALNVSTNGNGSAAEFNVTHAAGDKPAVIVKHQGAGPALVCESSDPESAALKIKGPLAVVGDGVLFTVSGGSNDYGFVRLDHPLLNGNPYAHMFVQPRTHPTFNQARQVYPQYVTHEEQWRLKSYDGGILLDGFRWDVLIVQKLTQ